jgi:hypothetical protein
MSVLKQRQETYNCWQNWLQGLKMWDKCSLVSSQSWCNDLLTKTTKLLWYCQAKTKNGYLWILYRNWNQVAYRLRLGVAWQQQYGKTSKMQTCWQVYVIEVGGWLNHTSQLTQLHAWHTKYWLLEWTQIWCHACSMTKVIKTIFVCPRHTTELCANHCHTKLNVWRLSNIILWTHKCK